jgi:hypothetical protein
VVGKCVGWILMQLFGGGYTLSFASYLALLDLYFCRKGDRIIAVLRTDMVLTAAKYL